MAPNQHFLQKADLSITNLTNEGGLLVPEQAKEFMEIMILKSKLMKLPGVNVKTMKSPTFEVPKMGFTGRVLRPATENSALPIADRVKPELGKVQLTTSEVIAEARIPYGVVEDNIENGTFPTHAMNLLAEAAARDMELMLIQGDTTSSDALLAMFDGLLKQATSNVVNAGGVRLSKAPLKTVLQTLPSQFRTENLVFLTSPNAVIDYNDSLSNRQTALGDEKLVKASKGEYNSHPVIDIPLFPENIGTGSNKTNVLLVDTGNIWIGLQRDIRIETARDISARQFIIVGTIRFGTKYAHEPAVAKVTEILAVAG